MTKFSARPSRQGLLSFGLLALGLFVFAPPSFAQMGVSTTITNCRSSANPAGSIMPQCASEATSYATYTYLTSGTSISLASVAGDGLMPLLRKIADNTSANNENQRQDMPNTDLANRYLQDQNNAQNALYAASMPISQAACSEASAGGSLGGGAGAHSKTVKDQAKDGAVQAFLTPHTEDDYVAGLVSSPSAKDYCSAADVKNNVPNCKEPGKYPGANTDPSSLIRGAGPAGNRTYSYKWPQNPAAVEGLSIPFGTADYPQYNAAMAYIQMASPLPAPKSAAGAYNTMAGKVFLINQRRYNSRALAVINTLLGVASESAALPPNDPSVAAMWDSSGDGMGLKDDFKAVYPNVTPPDSPSERELMELLVLRQFTDRVAGNDAGTNDAIALQKRQLELAKVNAYVNLKVAERLDTQNILLANLLSNALDPVTRDQLRGSSGSGAGAQAAKP